MSRRALWLGTLLVLVADSVVLTGVWRNRSGTPASVIELTERELVLSGSRTENSGIALRLDWIGPPWYPLRAVETFGAPAGDSPGWLDGAKLGEVGFDTSVSPGAPAAESHYRRMLPRIVFVALEYDGEAWQKWIARQREQTQPPAQAGVTGTRLVAIDVGADPASLRRRYPDQNKYLIARGVVRLYLTRKWDPPQKRYTGPPTLMGNITELLPGEIHVPLPFARVLAARPSHYRVGLAYGRNLEPWVTSCRPAAE